MIQPPEPQPISEKIFTPLTRLIGREQALGTVKQLLRHSQVRLLTLTGPGGVGKTRLAQQAAAESQGEFADGLLFVSLASLTDPALVLPTIAHALDLREEGKLTPFNRLIRYLADRQLLLLLDNFEQVAAAAPQLVDLLTACPDLKVLVTSREVLRVRGEHEFVVPLLVLPDLQRLASIQAGLAAVLANNPAVTLFVERAQAVRPDFQLTDENAGSVAEICARLGGLPLALELAAARVKLFSPPALLAQLNSTGYLQLLTGGARDLPARQRTLRQTIQWSYELLSADEQALFRRLSAFAGGFTLAAAEKVMTAYSVSGVEALTALVDKSLLQIEQTQSGPRFSMLVMVREFGLEQLQRADEAQAVQHTHALIYLELAETAAARLGGSEQERWLDQLEAEYANLRAALQWLIDRGDTEKALRLSIALTRFWILRGHLSEAHEGLEKALRLVEGSGIAPTVRAQALNSAGLVALYLGDLRRASALGRESVALFREQGDQAGVSAALQTLGQAIMRSGEFPAAQALLEESLTVCRALDDAWGIAHALLYLGLITFLRGEYETAQTSIEAGLARYRQLGDPQAIAQATQALGWIKLGLNEITSAQALFEESLGLCQAARDRAGLARALYALGEVERQTGNLVTARAHLDEACSLLLALGDKYHLIACLVIFANLMLMAGQRRRAAQCLGAVDSLKEPLFTAMPVYFRTLYQHTLTSIQAQLSPADFEAARGEGQAQAAANAWEQLLAAPELEAAGSAVASPASPDGLTEREIEVLQLLARGLTNAQIAERLVVSLFTVKAHLRSIFGKLNVSSRTAAARYALDHQLSPK